MKKLNKQVHITTKPQSHTNSNVELDILHGIPVQEDMVELQAAMRAAETEVGKAILFPTFEQMALYASQHPQLTFAAAMEQFAERCGSAALPKKGR